MTSPVLFFPHPDLRWLGSQDLVRFYKQIVQEGFYLIRCCNYCLHDDYFPLTKREAAFDLYDDKQIRNTPCTACGKTQNASILNFKPDFDKEIFIEWGNNLNLVLSSQNENLMIADENHVDVILDIIDHEQILPIKKIMLIDALCILVYYGIGDDKGRKAVGCSERVAEELRKRQELVLEARPYIEEHIRKKVFPVLGIKQK